MKKNSFETIELGRKNLILKSLLYFFGLLFLLVLIIIGLLYIKSLC